MAIWISIQFAQVLLLALTTQCDRLNQYISYYEPLINPSVPLFDVQQQSKLNFNAFGREFHLILVHGNRVFDSNTKLTVHVENNSKILTPSEINRHLATGHVKEERDSSVNGYILEGIFNGIISLPEETYYVEPAREYLEESKISFKSIIYRLSDVNVTSPPCKDHQESCSLSNDTILTRNVKGFEYLNVAGGATTEKVGDGDSDQKATGGVGSATDATSRGKICTLRVVVDHVYYQKASTHTFVNIIAKLISIFEGVDHIYRRADFDLDGLPNDIGLKISEIVIWWSSDQPGYKLSDETLSSVDFLKLLAMDDMSSVCLVFAITARNFGKSIGLAAGRQIDAGICAKKPLRGIRMNVAVASLYLGDQQLPNSLAELVIAHEIGHSFGSNHDPAAIGPCSPSDEDGGAYLMNANMVSTRLPNSDVFSSCSLQSISKLMKTLGTSCFVNENAINSCGNGIVDSFSEICDCGHREQCDIIDYCCTPQGGLYTDKECEYRKSNGAQCSFRQDNCCNARCRIVPAIDHLHCNEEEECKIPSFCDGISKECPSSGNQPDGTICRSGLGSCQDGVCQETVCKTAGLTTCICPEWKDDCQLCCLYRGWCEQASILGIIMESGLPYMKPDGDSCINGRGVCIRRKCQEVGRMLLTGRGNVESRGLSMTAEQTSAVIVFIVVVNFGLFLLAVLLYCVYIRFRPIRRRHERSTWREEIRKRRSHSAENVPPEKK